MHWLGYNDAVSWLNGAKTRIFQPTANFEIFEFTCISSACLPAIRPSCVRCRAPEISHDKGNGSGFTKMLFQRRFTHCSTTIPFILLSVSLLFFIPLARCESHLHIQKSSTLCGHPDVLLGYMLKKHESLVAILYPS